MALRIQSGTRLRTLQDSMRTSREERINSRQWSSFERLIDHGASGHENSQGPRGGRIGVDEFNSRLKGFLDNRIVRNAEDIRRLNRLVDQGIEYLNTSNQTRLTLRALVADHAVHSINNVEAVLPLRDGVSIAYIGYNKEGRRISDSEDVSKRVAYALNNAFLYEGGNFSALGGLLRQARDEGIRVRIVDGYNMGNDVFAGIAQLMWYHGYNDDVKVLQALHGNRIAIATHNGTVVGLSVGESATVNINGRAVNIVESTNATIHPEYRGRGEINRVYAAVTTLLVTSYAHEDTVVYSESNATKSTVLAVRAMQGGVIGHLDDMPNGILDQHVRMRTSSGVPEFFPLAVNYFSENGIERILESEEIMTPLREMQRV